MTVGAYIIEGLHYNLFLGNLVMLLFLLIAKTKHRQLFFADIRNMDPSMTLREQVHLLRPHPLRAWVIMAYVPGINAIVFILVLAFVIVTICRID